MLASPHLPIPCFGLLLTASTTASTEPVSPVGPAGDPEYPRARLALVHHLGFGSYGEACAPGVLALLEPVRARAGLVLELGC